jgi:hypothetical protein
VGLGLTALSVVDGEEPTDAMDVAAGARRTRHDTKPRDVGRSTRWCRTSRSVVDGEKMAAAMDVAVGARMFGHGTNLRCIEVAPEGGLRGGARARSTTMEGRAVEACYRSYHCFLLSSQLSWDLKLN